MSDDFTYTLAWKDGYNCCKRELTPKWSKEFPTTTGWYFYRNTFNDFPEILVGYLYEDEFYLEANNLKTSLILKGSPFPYEFAGPILEPKE